MYNNISQFGKKITVIVTMLVALSVVSITIISFYRNKKTVEDFYVKSINQNTSQYTEGLLFKADEIAHSIEKISEKKRSFVIPYFQLKGTINSSDSLKNKYAELTHYFKKEIFIDLMSQKAIEDVFLVNTTTAEAIQVFQYTSNDLINKPKKFKNIDNESVNLHVREACMNHPIAESGKYYTYISHPIHVDDIHIGMIIVKVNLSSLAHEVKTDNNFLKKSNYVTELIKLEKGQVFKLFSTEDSISQFSVKGDDLLNQSVTENWMQQSANYTINKIGENTRFDYWTYEKKLGVCVLTKVLVGKKEYNHGNFSVITLLIGLGIIIVTFLLAVFFSRILSYPIIKLKKVLNLVSKGVLPQELKTPLKDEVGEMINTVNEIILSLKETASFAHKIGQGEFDTDFKPISKQDILGNALVEMRESLLEANTKDETQNWIVEGLASMGSILRSYDNMKEISDEVIQFICKRVNALQGAMLLVEGEDNKEIVLTATYAYGKHKNLKRRFKFGEGLIGQAAVEKNVIARSEIPENYTLITSGLLGDKHPNHLLVVPLIYNEEVFGVVELASFTMFESDVIDFMEQVAVIISRTIFNINVNEHTRQLLEQSQRLSSELTENKEQLEGNAKQMAQSQIELREMNEKLQVQISKVGEAQERQTALLTNSDEVIFILKESGIVKYVSPSITRILGYKEEDVQDTYDSKRVSDEFQDAVQEFFTDIMQKTETEEQTIQYEYYKKNGDLVWLEAVGTNQLSNPAINGLVINVRDITIKRQAEEEQRKRSQMQSLSENSTDLIMRIGLDMSVFYVNPFITNYTGMKPEDLFSKTIDKSFINKYVNNAYVELLKMVSESNDIVQIEADFIKEDKKEIFSIKGIPEFDSQGKLESVLMISHNVTAEKTIEREIKEKNKQIEDSIYYAENIQNILLPETSLIMKSIPDAFVLFKPRDIVSGDFPWYKEHNGYLYLAAVDCTGHGVPGAMIATVGYFLLNSILLDETKTPDAGEVLNQLDALVTSTFKQDDEASKLKDGMDMVLCRIKIGNGQVDIASANRPIYQINKSKELIEIKGDKFPIGGGLAYSNKTKFTNNVLHLEKDESLYFFSDGLQDQFDEVGAKKFGTRRIKDILICEHGSMANKQIAMEKEFEQWKGKGEQTDDILVVGLGF